MRENGLELAIEKTELIMLSNRNKRNKMAITLDGHRLESVRSIKYLGLQVDARFNFVEHSELATRRATQVGKQLSYLLPNTRGP